MRGADPAGRIQRGARISRRGNHPGRTFDDAYRQFVNQIADQITIGLASARAFEQEHQTEREKLRASEQRLAETSRLYREQQLAATELQIQVDLLQQLPVATWTLDPDGRPGFGELGLA